MGIPVQVISSESVRGPLTSSTSCNSSCSGRLPEENSVTKRETYYHIPYAIIRPTPDPRYRCAAEHSVSLRWRTLLSFAAKAYVGVSNVAETRILLTVCAGLRHIRQSWTK